MSATSPQPSRVRAVTIVIALLVIAAMVAPAVLAHAQLLSSDPANGATLPTTDAVSLTFNEDINPDFVQIVAEGPDGDVTDGDPVVAGPVVTQPLSPTSSGSHTVTYRVVSADGHPVSGSLTFTLTDVAPGTATEAATSEATSSAPTTGTSTDAPATPESATPVSNDEAVASATGTDGDGGGSSTWLVAGGLAALVAAGGGIAWAVRTRRHPEH